MEEYVEDEFEDVKPEETNDLNILLLGETGIGKSTFINSIANYIHHHDLDEAMQEDLYYLIPCVFNIPDDNSRFHEVVVGADDNEWQKVGESATQDVRSYVFSLKTGKTRVRLIDTPGIGDPRGVEQDDMNCDKILSKIGHLHYLHAICILFRPNDARITVTFEYCVKQILSRLEKSAARNIIFVFTNSKATNYKPGETVACLKKVVDDIQKQPPHVKIKVEDNVFCFDNEAFRFLAATKKTLLQFNDETKTEYSKSWEKASAEFRKLICYIVGDDHRVALVPHLVKSSKSINEARRVINQLSQPLGDISQLILDNLNVLDRRQKELQEDYQTLDKLKEKLHVPVINFQVMKLTHPATVCCGSECAEIVRICGRNIWNYKQRCHDPCYLKNVPQDIIGAPQLEHCRVMDRTTQTCIKCRCARDAHMHVYYMTRFFNDKKIDRNIQNKITTKENALEEAKNLIKEIKRRKSELEHEKDVIILCAAKFAEFLQKSAITPFNDAYRKYISLMIYREQNLGKNADQQAIQHFENLLTKYEQIKQAFDGVRKFPNHDDRFKEMEAEDLQTELEKLYALKHNGNKIRELYSTQNASRQKEYKKSEYVYPFPMKKSKGTFENHQTQSDEEEKTKTYTQKIKTHKGRSEYKPNISKNEVNPISQNWRIRDNTDASNPIPARRNNPNQKHYSSSRVFFRGSSDINSKTLDPRDISNDYNLTSATFSKEERTPHPCQPRYNHVYGSLNNLEFSHDDSARNNTRHLKDSDKDRSDLYRPPHLRRNYLRGNFNSSQDSRLDRDFR